MGFHADVFVGDSSGSTPDAETEEKPVKKKKGKGLWRRRTKAAPGLVR